MLQKIPIKFAVRLKEVGESIPLKIWKINGVNSVEIGTVDLFLTRYLKK